MRWAILTLNRQGIGIGQQLYAAGLNQENLVIDIYTNKPIQEARIKKYEEPVSTFYERMSPHYDAVIYIMAMGIIVRSIQPIDKRYDKPVICIQLRGEYVIPVIGGHLGGANEIAVQIADYLGAQAIITTASDLCQIDSVDMIAKKKGWVLMDMNGAKCVTADWVEGKNALILSEVDLDTIALNEHYMDVIQDTESDTWMKRYSLEGYTSLLLVTAKKGCESSWMDAREYSHVQLIPKNLVLGIGCKKGVSDKHIQASISVFMEAAGYYEEGIGMVASIDIKKEEPGIVAWAQGHDIPFVTFSAAQLDKEMDRFESSNFVQSVTGSRGVCMPAGYIASDYGQCLVKKQAFDGVTLCLWKRR